MTECGACVPLPVSGWHPLTGQLVSWLAFHYCLTQSRHISGADVALLAVDVIGIGQLLDRGKEILDCMLDLGQ